MPAEQTTRRKLTAQDLFRFQMVDDPQISPDGTQIAWVRTWIDPAENRYRAHIWLTDLASGDSRALTQGSGQDTLPRWSPDGRRLAYLSARPQTPAADGGPAGAISVLDKGAQLHLIDPLSGEDRTLTQLRGGAMAPAWSPDGTRIAFLTYVVAGSGLESMDQPADEDTYTRFNRDVLVVQRVRWKSDSAGYVGDTYRQIALVAVDNPTPTLQLVTRGEYDLSAPVWSPDGRWLATTGNGDPDGELQRKSYIYLIEPDAASPAPPVQIFGLEEMRSQDLAWSADGSTLAVCGHNDPVIGHYGNQYLWLVDVAARTGRCVTGWLDRALGDYSRNADMRRYGGDDGPRWLPDEETLLALVNEGGSVSLAEIDPARQVAKHLTAGRQCVVAFTLDKSANTAALLVGDDMNPGDLFVLRRGADGQFGDLQRLTHVNGELLDELALTEPIRFMARSGEVEIDTWVVPPVDLEAGKRYPVILYTGGGPGGMRASVFCHEFHLYAAQGYVVVHCNTRGNHGYGQDFSTPTRGQWGVLDLEDNMAALDAACVRFDFIDPTRKAVAGGSYGGLMATWTIIRHPEFKAAVVDRCLFNRYSFNGTSDMGFLLDRVEFDKRLPWEAVEIYLERSPMTHIGSVRTPTLVVHSELDHRCPVEQGEQLYIALQRVGVPTQLVRFPNESHELSRSGRPWHRIFRLESYLDWFARWL